MSDSDTRARALDDILMGPLIGEGIGRKVYACRIDPRCVIKVECEGESFQNTIEWETWKRAKGTRAARYLAPCWHISPAGSVLVQARTEPIPRARLPKRMPGWLCDFKHANYGLFEGRVVCHDYGLPWLLDLAFEVAPQTVKWK